jgi:SP family arabinose:H+ symporter-like MFS transporter
MCFGMGFNTGMIAGALLYLELNFPELKSDKMLNGAVTSSVFFSAFLSNIFVGSLTDYLGRVPVLRLTTIPFVLGAVVVALAKSPEMIILGRSITGLAAGAAGSLPNLYIAEIVPTETRGKFVGRAPLCITFGIMASQLFALAVAEVLGEANCKAFGWRIMFGCGAFPVLIQAIWSRGIPESPRWCYQKGLIEVAEQSNRMIESLDGGERVEASPPETTSERRCLTFKLVLIACGLSAMQQLSGINAVVFYAPKIYQGLGLGNKLAILSSTCTSIAQVLTIHWMSQLVDSWGRRTLCKIGLVGMVCGHFMLGLTFTFQLSVFMAIAGITVFRILFSFSLGPLPYIMVTELFPQQERARGVAASMMVNWLMNWLVVFSVPELMHLAGGLVFFGFAVACALSLVIVQLSLPETAGVRLGETRGRNKELYQGAGDRSAFTEESSFDFGASLPPLAATFDGVTCVSDCSTTSTISNAPYHHRTFC